MNDDAVEIRVYHVRNKEYTISIHLIEWWWILFHVHFCPSASCHSHTVCKWSRCNYKCCQYIEAGKGTEVLCLEERIHLLLTFWETWEWLYDGPLDHLALGQHLISRKSNNFIRIEEGRRSKWYNHLVSAYKVMFEWMKWTVFASYLRSALTVVTIVFLQYAHIPYCKTINVYTMLLFRLLCCGWVELRMRVCQPARKREWSAFTPPHLSVRFQLNARDPRWDWLESCLCRTVSVTQECLYNVITLFISSCPPNPSISHPIHRDNTPYE